MLSATTNFASPASTFTVSVTSRFSGISKSNTMGLRLRCRMASRIASSAGFRSLLKLPRMRTDLDVIVSMTSRLSRFVRRR